MTKNCSITFMNDYWRDENWYYELRFSCGATMTDEANYHVPGTPTLTSNSFSYCPFCGKPLNNPTMKGT